MPKLADPLKEEFAKRVAAGQSSKRDCFLQARMVIGVETPISSDSASAGASKLLKDPDVRARIDELLGTQIKQIEPAGKLTLREAIERNPRLVEHAALTREWVIDKLVENVERAMTAVPVLNSDGEPTGEWKYQGNVANKALELLGKHLGMFAEQPDVDKGKYVLRDRPLTEQEWIEQHADRSN